MSTPTVVFVFADADGDEFPVRVGAPLWAGDGGPEAAAWRAARGAIAQGGWRPTGELKLLRKEED